MRCITSDVFHIAKRKVFKAMFLCLAMGTLLLFSALAAEVNLGEIRDIYVEMVLFENIGGRENKLDDGTTDKLDTQVASPFLYNGRILSPSADEKDGIVRAIGNSTPNWTNPRYEMHEEIAKLRTSQFYRVIETVAWIQPISRSHAAKINLTSPSNQYLDKAVAQIRLADVLKLKLSLLCRCTSDRFLTLYERQKQNITPKLVEFQEPINLNKIHYLDDNIVGVLVLVQPTASDDRRGY